MGSKLITWAPDIKLPNKGISIRVSAPKIIIISSGFLAYIEYMTELWGASTSLKPRLSIPDFVSQLWRKMLWDKQKLQDKIRNGEPGFEAELLPAFWIKPATWLHFVHEIAVPIFWSPQCCWWALVLAEMCTVQWATLECLYAGFFLREMWFVDCPCWKPGHTWSCVVKKLTDTDAQWQTVVLPDGPWRVQLCGTIVLSSHESP